MENKNLSFTENTRRVVDFAVRRKLPLEEVLKVYNHFNSGIYRNHLDNGGEFRFYNPDLEEKTFRLTEWYFNLPKN